MISEELRKYIDMVNEEAARDTLMEMARVGPVSSGIDRVVIWVGQSIGIQHGLRIKVSNIPNKMDSVDNFSIRMPSLDYDPTQVAKWIDRKTMDKILLWIKVNQQLLYDYETGVIEDTMEFMKQIEKV